MFSITTQLTTTLWQEAMKSRLRFLKGKTIRICTSFLNMSEEADIILTQHVMFLDITESQESLWS